MKIIIKRNETKFLQLDLWRRIIFKRKKYIYQEKDFKIGNERTILENKWIKKITKIRNSTKKFKSTFYHKFFKKKKKKWNYNLSSTLSKYRLLDSTYIIPKIKKPFKKNYKKAKTHRQEMKLGTRVNIFIFINQNFGDFFF